MSRRRIGRVEVQFRSLFDLGTRWRWVVSFTHRPLYPQGKSRWYPFDRRLGGLQSPSGRGGEEKNSQPRRESNPRTPIVQPVAQQMVKIQWVKLSLIKHHVMKTPGESGVIVPHFLKLGTRWRWVVSFTLPVPIGWTPDPIWTWL
jgi:hypothetical protein